MKNLFMIASMVLMTSGVFASETAQKKEALVEKSTKVAEKAPEGCCTAYLYYNGTLVDQETSCGPYTTQGNCGVAGSTLLDRNPKAKAALTR